MKIIENMNAQKLTEKKIASKLEFIKRYAARPSIREDAFENHGHDPVPQLAVDGQCVVPDGIHDGHCH